MSDAITPVSVREDTMDDSAAADSNNEAQRTGREQPSDHAETDIRAAARQLHALLEAPPEHRPEDWEPQVSPLVSKLAVDFLTQRSEEVALMEAALVGWAAVEGSQTARKKQLKLSRWVSTRPPGWPPEFTSEAGQLAVVRVLSGVGRNWAPTYIPMIWPAVTSDKVKTEVVSWLLKNSPSAARLFKELSSEVPAMSLDEAVDLLARIAKQATRTGWVFQVTRERDTLESLAALHRALADRSESFDEALTASLQQFVLELAALCVQANPPLALDLSLAELLDKVASAAHDKKRRSARAALDVIVRLAQSEAEFARDVLEAPGAIKEAARRTGRVMAKYAKGDWLPVEPMSGDTTKDLTSQVVALLITWDDVVANPGRAAEFAAALQQFAGELAIERLEQEGEVCLFRDDMHQLVGREGDAVPVQGYVTVLRHGYLRRRPDGSFVVLMKALVEGATGA